MIIFTLLLYDLIPHIMTRTFLRFTYLTIAAKASLDSITAKYMNLVETIRFHQVENAYAVKRLIPVSLPLNLTNIREMIWLIFWENYHPVKLPLPKKKQSSTRLSTTSPTPRK